MMPREERCYIRKVHYDDWAAWVEENLMEDMSSYFARCGEKVHQRQQLARTIYPRQ